MIIQHTYRGIDYILTNENLKEGDKVFPISRGRSYGDTHIHYEYDFRDFMCGFPNEPHTIVNIKYSTYKPYEVNTDHGFGPREMYYKIVVSMNKNDYLVDRRPHPKTKEPWVFVMDKASRSTQMLVGENEKFVTNKALSYFLTDWEIHCLKLFRTEPEEPQKGPIKFHKTYELVDVLKRYDDKKENTTT